MEWWRFGLREDGKGCERMIMINVSIMMGNGVVMVGNGVPIPPNWKFLLPLEKWHMWRK